MVGGPREGLCALFGGLSGMEFTASTGWEHRTVLGRGRDLGVVSVWTTEWSGHMGEAGGPA